MVCGLMETFQCLQMLFGLGNDSYPNKLTITSWWMKCVAVLVELKLKNILRT